MKKIIRINPQIMLFVLLFFLFSSFAFALDFGLALNQYAGYGKDDSEENKFEYKGSIVPRLSVPIGANGEIFLSASMTLGYDEEIYYYPELLRTEYNFRQGGWGLRIGRIVYSDQSGSIASGLFDGLQVSYSSGIGRFMLGAFYTGFIFKKNASVSMTQNDQDMLNSELDYGDFFNTYFGSKRALACLEWEHPSILDTLNLKISLLGQFDLNSVQEKLHSEYFILKMGLPISSFIFEAGGSFSALQVMEADELVFKTAFAFNLGVNWILPLSFYSRLSLTADYTSGSMSEKMAAFVPISDVYLGTIFNLKRDAVTVISLDYSARAAESLGLGIKASYFVRNDLVSGDYPVEKNEFFLGPEIFAKIVWSPVSDIQFNLGGGVFIPALGNAMPNAPIQWKAELTAVLALY